MPFLLACPSDQGGQGSATDPMARTSGGQDTADTAVDSTSAGTTAAGTVDGSATSTGSSGGTSTTDPPPETSSEGTSDSSGSSSDDGVEQPGVGEPYGACDRQGMCLDDNTCYAYMTFDMCLPPCGPGPGFECPAEPGGTAFAECIEVVGVRCMLNCADGLECPEGTSCQEVFTDIFRCLWP